jgi:Fic family protein
LEPADFRSRDAGSVIQAPEGYHAFVPAPLPPRIDYDADLVFALSQADAAVSELAGVGRTLPNPHLFIYPYILQEAVLSSRIEGTETQTLELLLNQVGEPTTGNPADRQEVENYVRALEYGCARLNDLPLSKRLVCEIHATLLDGVRGKTKTPGEFRRSQNWIGGSNPTNAVYVPPPVEHMQKALDAWERFLNEPGKIPVLVQCALMHAQFESIHPFLDGNGRTGRLLITLLLMERGRLTQPLLYLSAYIEVHKEAYYERLQGVRTDGAWNAWLHYFLTGVTEAAAAAARQAARLMDLWREYEYRLRDKPKSHVLVSPLFANPFMTVARAQSILKVSNPTARKAVSLLQERGLIENVKESPWQRLYVAKPLLDILAAPPL